MNWGNKIALVYGSFALLMGTMVVIAIRQPDIFLVQKDYYKEEIAYQARINEIENGRKSNLSLLTSNNNIVIANPSNQGIANGKLMLYRPSSALYDDTLSFTVAGLATQTVQITNRPKGYYKIRLFYNEGGKPCYKEGTITL